MAHTLDSGHKPSPGLDRRAAGSGKPLAWAGEDRWVVARRSVAEEGWAEAEAVHSLVQSDRCIFVSVSILMELGYGILSKAAGSSIAGAFERESAAVAAAAGSVR